jgi:hypothetical protein
MSLTGAWAKLQMQMEMDRIRAHYDTQQKMLEVHKAMWDKHDKNNSANMLTIRNINKIVGKTLPISNTRMHTLAMARVEDVYEFIDNTYEFRIKIETPDSRNNNIYRLKLNRNKIPYPVALKNCWELSYEEKPNQIIVEAIQKSELRDMGEMIRIISNLMDRILNR